MENFNIAEAEAQIRHYFDFYGADTSNWRFHIEDLAKENDITLLQANALCSNLEDVELMQELAEGNYNSFDVYDPALFNDGYDSIMEQLGLDSSDDEDEDF